MLLLCTLRKTMCSQNTRCWLGIFSSDTVWVGSVCPIFVLYLFELDQDNICSILKIAFSSMKEMTPCVFSKNSLTITMKPFIGTEGALRLPMYTWRWKTYNWPKDNITHRLDYKGKKVKISASLHKSMSARSKLTLEENSIKSHIFSNLRLKSATSNPPPASLGCWRRWPVAFTTTSRLPHTRCARHFTL